MSNWHLLLLLDTFSLVHWILTPWVCVLVTACDLRNKVHANTIKRSVNHKEQLRPTSQWGVHTIRRRDDGCYIPAAAPAQIRWIPASIPQISVAWCRRSQISTTRVRWSDEWWGPAYETMAVRAATRLYSQHIQYRWGCQCPLMRHSYANTLVAKYLIESNHLYTPGLEQQFSMWAGFKLCTKSFFTQRPSRVRWGFRSRSEWTARGTVRCFTHTLRSRTDKTMLLSRILSSILPSVCYVGKQAKKSAHRKTIDYNAAVLRTLQVTLVFTPVSSCLYWAATTFGFHHSNTDRADSNSLLYNFKFNAQY